MIVFLIRLPPGKAGTTRPVFTLRKDRCSSGPVFVHYSRSTWQPPLGVLGNFHPKNLSTRMAHNFCSMRSFFKRKKTLESSRWELSNGTEIISWRLITVGGRRFRRSWYTTLGVLGGRPSEYLAIFTRENDRQEWLITFVPWNHIKNVGKLRMITFQRLFSFKNWPHWNKHYESFLSTFFRV